MNYGMVDGKDNANGNRGSAAASAGAPRATRVT